jgi:hypothetical protein
MNVLNYSPSHPIIHSTLLRTLEPVKQLKVQVSAAFLFFTMINGNCKYTYFHYIVLVTTGVFDHKLFYTDMVFIEQKQNRFFNLYINNLIFSLFS